MRQAVKEPEQMEGQERAWWTTRELAAEWEVSERTIWRWLAEGRFTEGTDYTRSEGGGGSITGQLLWEPAALPDWAGDA